jgi:hypothetical protein
MKEDRKWNGDKTNKQKRYESIIGERREEEKCTEIYIINGMAFC